MHRSSICPRVAAGMVVALMSTPALAQAPDLFQSAPGPAPVARPALRPRPPPAEPPPAVVAPTPAAPVRPEGALREAELHQLIDSTQIGASHGSTWNVYNSPDGRSFLKGVNSDGRPIADSGHWSIENDTMCFQWDHFLFGRRGCQYVFKKGNGYENRNLDGTSNAEYTIQRGNVYHLP